MAEGAEKRRKWLQNNVRHGRDVKKGPAVRADRIFELELSRNNSNILERKNLDGSDKGRLTPNDDLFAQSRNHFLDLDGTKHQPA